MDRNYAATVEINAASDGSIAYLVAAAPSALPAVRARDLAAAWEAARAAALQARPGPVRGFRFCHPDGRVTALALSDRDARCWAGAIERQVGLGDTYGLSLCLRLLALIDLLARARWMAGLLAMGRDGASLHPALLRAAASEPLGEMARFDEAGFHQHLAPLIPAIQGALS
jgi:hypothetical protein